MNRKPVSSSNSLELGYSEASMTLELMFANGWVYQYFDVPPNVAHDLEAAASLGQYFNQHIRGQYRYARV